VSLKRPWLWLFGLLAVVGVLHMIGAGAFGLGDMARALFSGPGGSPSQVVLWELRLPRFVAALLVGGGLGVVGACFQALFRNPLADPYILGVSSGAAVGGALASLLPAALLLGGLITFLAAFATAVTGMVAVIAMARKVAGRVQLASLLLAGVAVGSFLWAAVTLVLVLAGQDSSRILFWLLGSFSAMAWSKVVILAIVTLGFGLVLFRNARTLTVFATGEEVAMRLGIGTEGLKRSTLIGGTAIAAAAVSAVGIIGFVGLFVPHIARRLFGPDLRRSMPASFLIGAGGMAAADLIAQRALGGQEINVGVVTALVGAPFLVSVLRKH
jgi:iron complex transport system permease protein